MFEDDAAADAMSEFEGGGGELPDDEAAPAVEAAADGEAGEDAAEDEA